MSHTISPSRRRIGLVIAERSYQRARKMSKTSGEPLNRLLCNAIEAHTKSVTLTEAEEAEITATIEARARR